MMNSKLPSQDLLDRVRHIAAWDIWFSAKVGKELGDEGRRSYLGDKLRSIMSELEIEVSHREARGIFGGKYKLTYVVAHRGAIQLEFTDLLRDKTDLRTLESVRTYHAGEWEQKVNAAFKKCLDLSNQWNSVPRLIDQLGSASHTPEDITGFIEATGDPEQTIKLLALSSEQEAAIFEDYTTYLKEQNQKQLKKEEELRREQSARKWLTGALPAVLALHSITYVSEWWQSVLIFFGGAFVFRLFLFVWDFLKGRH